MTVNLNTVQSTYAAILNDLHGKNKPNLSDLNKRVQALMSQVAELKRMPPTPEGLARLETEILGLKTDLEHRMASAASTTTVRTLPQSKPLQKLEMPKKGTLGAPVFVEHYNRTVEKGELFQKFGTYLPRLELLLAMLQKGKLQSIFPGVEAQISSQIAQLKSESTPDQEDVQTKINEQLEMFYGNEPVQKSDPYKILAIMDSVEEQIQQEQEDVAFYDSTADGGIDLDVLAGAGLVPREVLEQDRELQNTVEVARQKAKEALKAYFNENYAADFEVIEVPDDGDCLYHAIAKQVIGSTATKDDAFTIRQQIAAEMRRINSTLPKPKYTETEITNVETRSAGSESTKTWGTDDYFDLIANLYNRPVYKYHPSYTGIGAINHLVIDPTTSRSGSALEPIHLITDGMEHWEGLKPKSKAAVEVPVAARKLPPPPTGPLPQLPLAPPEPQEEKLPPQGFFSKMLGGAVGFLETISFPFVLVYRGVRDFVREVIDFLSR